MASTAPFVLHVISEQNLSRGILIDQRGGGVSLKGVITHRKGNDFAFLPLFLSLLNVIAQYQRPEGARLI